MAPVAPDPQHAAPPPQSGQSESLNLSLVKILMEISGKLESLGAAQIGNREAMLQRTGDMMRSIDQRFLDLKDEVFHRFTRTEDWIERIDGRQREAAAATADKPPGRTRTVFATLGRTLRMLPLMNALPMVLAGLITLVMNLLPAEVRAAVNWIIEALSWLLWGSPPAAP